MQRSDNNGVSTYICCDIASGVALGRGRKTNILNRKIKPYHTIQLGIDPGKASSDLGVSIAWDRCLF